MKLIVLCVDGIDPDYAASLGFSMKYESELEIPVELFHDGEPHTLHIWPSIFTGKITRNSKLEELKKETWGPRLKIRRWLLDHEIRWRRENVSVIKYSKSSPEKYQPKWQVYQSETATLFDQYDSYIWNIPGVSPSFIMGGSLEHYKQNFITWKILARALPQHRMDIAAVYTAYLDWLGHWMSPLKLSYFEVFDLANTLGKNIPVMLVSDHGCINGQHTHKAYLGSNCPVKARNITEVREDIENILSTQEEGLDENIGNLQKISCS